LISPEYGAAPFQNWNERILSECYTANARAHTMQGPVVYVRNNYESVSFDVGPTLAGWLQTHGKTAYRAMTRGDPLSASAHGGHGNAIAQSYSHSILPLLPPRDRELQIAWGIDDFVFRFGRKPAGMWLPNALLTTTRSRQSPRRESSSSSSRQIKEIFAAPAPSREARDRSNGAVAI